MSAAIEHMRRRLEADDLEGFLAAYEQYVLTAVFEPAAIPLTQVALPSALRRGFEKGSVTAKALVTLWRLALNGSLLLVENDLRSMINQNIDGALKTLAMTADLPAKPLPIRVEAATKLSDSVRRRREPPLAQECPQVKRVSIVSTFSIRTWSASDALDFRRNLCASNQEREFLRAIRQYFPSLQTYPNIALRNFIDLDELGLSIPESFRKFAWQSQVDILLCTCDEDPVAGFELDSSWHDSETAASRDDIKNQLFQLAGLPLFRIRPADPRAVRAEDFYDLLNAEPALDMIRPRRMRPRRTHDGLAPESVETVRRW
ncbi:DUF2726 domain-containing protein [Polaromonas sp. JS666]|uniref:DUF2726 domain-containing protein n=1 Tax=Polaromonas sp. (strain JS666 / ATCC BAA-500) TaxID=296591 RepID=UPI0000534F67|nr:DUF2726 domain-containing protein [Polaromonas sp. JS666]ABE46957.1 conserved hypothetical protein [Polaromonas sp. JS666]